MAQLIHSPTGGGPANAFEQRLVQHLVAALPGGYAVLPNFSLRDNQGRAYEYDVVVLAPHAVYVVEAKEWYGRLSGDDTEWLLNGKPRKCPLWLVEQKGKVLKGRTGIAHGLWVEPLLVVPNGIINELYGNWARSLLSIGQVAGVLRDPKSVKYPAATPLPHDSIQRALLGSRLARQHHTNRRFGSYELIETLARDSDSAEYLARHAVLASEERFRVRTWTLSPYLYPNEAERRNREAVIRRPAEALARIGRHPNLLSILAFDYDDDAHEFYEVTEWSVYGTLHGYLRHPDRNQLTLRERLEIAAGVAAALEAVHAEGLVHRDVCPETILIGFDRQPRLSDFDRAYIDHSVTVFAATTNRRRNPAYVPPELADETSYDFRTGSDMYSFGVLLFELLTNSVPFANPREAFAADGRPIALPSKLRDGVDTSLDDLIAGLLRVDDFNARPTAKEATAVLRAALRGSSAAAGGGDTEDEAAQSTHKPPQGESIVVNAMLDGHLRVDAVLGGGAFSRVYKVWHMDQQRAFAMKVLTREEDAEMLLAEYNKIGRFLPRHRHIARLVWMSRLAPPLGTPYILSEYVDGETLEAYCDGRKRLALSQVRDVGLKLLDALAALHGDPLQPTASAALSSLDTAQDAGLVFLHRDIKPANILLELPSGSPKLIDFNIATRKNEAAGRGGTPRYWAPDRGQPEWRPDHDLFSLGVVLYELVTHRHPYQDDRPESGKAYDPRYICPDIPLSAEFASFLLKAVQPHAQDRFVTAREMWRALRDITALHPAVDDPTPVTVLGSGSFPGVTLTADEIGKPNYNPYVTRLLSLFSQARRTNSGTRGLDEIARLTYVRTMLDDKLTPAIADAKFRLVVVTGNAGDGKTAYLQRVEDYFREQLGVTITHLSGGNGSRWVHDGLEYETNYDGSQDEGDLESDTVLARFLTPFSDDQRGLIDGRAIRLIAINEGRLLDFLDHSEERGRFTIIRKRLVHALAGGDTPSRLLVVNLNLRAVAAGGSASLVEQQLQRLLRDELWAPCLGCALRMRCPVKHNADSVRDPTSGGAVRERVRRLFEVVHLRRRAHVTMRDMRSALSWFLLRDHGCDDVAVALGRLEAAPSEQHLRLARDHLVRLAYPAAFMADEGPKEMVDDRLVRLLREADVGLVDDPRLDRRLDADANSAVPWMAFDGRSTYSRQLLEAWATDGPRSVEDGTPVEVLASRRRSIGMWRRWAYYERRDEGWRTMLPYRSLEPLERVLQAETDLARSRAGADIRDKVVEAISLSEGLRHTEVRKQYLALRVSRIKAPTVRSFRLFPRDEFVVLTAGGGQGSTYIEYAPDIIELAAAKHRGVANLRIQLDLLEMLELIRRGYRPSPADLQGLFVNLVIFRNELLNLPFEKVLLTQDDETFYELSASTSASGVIQLDLQRLGVDAIGGAAAGTDRSEL